MYVNDWLKRRWRLAKQIKDPRLKWPVLAVLALAILTVFLFGWIANQELSRQYGQWREDNPNLTGMKLYWSDWGELTVWGIVAGVILLLIALMFWWLRRPIPMQTSTVSASGDGGAHGEQRLIFLDAEVEVDWTKDNAVRVVGSVRSELSTDAVGCRLQIDSVMNSNGGDEGNRDHSLPWTTGHEEKTLTVSAPQQRFQIAHSYDDPDKIIAGRRITELVFSCGDTKVLKSRYVRAGGLFWISVQLTYHDGNPVYGVYRLDSDKLHGYRGLKNVSDSEVVKFIRQCDKPPNLKSLIGG